MINNRVPAPLEQNQLRDEFEYHCSLDIPVRMAINDDRRHQQLLFNQQIEQILPEPQERERRLTFDLQVVARKALKAAIIAEDYDQVERLLHEGADPDVPNCEGITFLHDTAVENNPKLAYLLCTYGANVNAPDCELYTPLHCSACCGNIDVINVLLEFDADLLFLDQNEHIPLDVCEDDETRQLIWEAMLARGFDADYLDKFRNVPEKKMLADLKAWHHEGKPLDVRYDDGSSFLHSAAAHGYYEVAKYLLRHLSPSLKDHDNWQPLHAAANWDHVDIIELLCRYDGADLNAETKTGERAIDLCEDMRTRAVLLQIEADFSNNNKKKRHPYGARDSRARIRKKKMGTSGSSNAMLPSGSAVEEEASPFKRGVLRRHSLRDKTGMKLARIEEQKEGREMMKFWAGNIPLDEDDLDESSTDPKKKKTKKTKSKSSLNETLNTTVEEKSSTKVSKKNKKTDNETVPANVVKEKKKRRLRYCCLIS